MLYNLALSKLKWLMDYTNMFPPANKMKHTSIREINSELILRYGNIVLERLQSGPFKEGKPSIFISMS